MPKLLQKMIVFYVAYEGVPDEARYDIMAPGSTARQLEAVKAIKAVNGYVPVAAVEYDDCKSVGDNLEVAYKAMQNGVITDSWTLSPPDGLMPLVDPIKHDRRDMGHRSMSMGDLIEFGGNQYVVATFGFKKLP